MNPLISPSNEKFGIEPYSLITIDHYREAFEHGMKTQHENIQAIVEDTADPNFHNTIEAFDKSGDDLQRVSLIFSALSESNSTEEIRKFETEIYPRLASHSDDLYLNAQLFQRIKTVHDYATALEKSDTAALSRSLNHEQLSTVKKVYHEFESAGAALPEEQQKRLRELNLKLSDLELQFSQNLLHETNNTYVFIEDKENLTGLSDANIAAAEQMAKEQGKAGQYAFNMQRPSCYPVLQTCSNRSVRQKVYEAYYGRGNQQNEWNNAKIAKEIIALRIEKSKLFGYDASADMILKERMAKNPEAVYHLLDAVWKPALGKLQEELAAIQHAMEADGIKDEPMGWDIMYYLNKIKASKYQVDEQQLSQYFEINQVLKGIFHVAERLYGLTFKEITDEVPAYEPSAKAWQVADKNGETLAIFYTDYFPRDGKGAGAWMTEFRRQTYAPDGKRRIPIVVNVCNMTKPSGDGQPALQSIDNVQTILRGVL